MSTNMSIWDRADKYAEEQSAPMLQQFESLENKLLDRFSTTMSTVDLAALCNILDLIREDVVEEFRRVVHHREQRIADLESMI